MSRKDLIQIPGKVMKVLGSGIMEVNCDNDLTVTGRLSGRMKMHQIKVMVGDQVHVSVSPYDPSHGIIAYRSK
jgi:translation initiation factor IF-1